MVCGSEEPPASHSPLSGTRTRVRPSIRGLTVSPRQGMRAGIHPARGAEHPLRCQPCLQPSSWGYPGGGTKLAGGHPSASTRGSPASPQPFSLPTASLPGLGRGSGHSADRTPPAPPASPSPAWPTGTSAGVPHLHSALASVSPALRALDPLSVPLFCCPQCPPVLLSPALLSVCPGALNSTPDTPQSPFQRPLQPHCPQPRCQHPHPCHPLAPRCPQPSVTASPRGQHPSSLSTPVPTASPSLPVSLPGPASPQP